MARSFRFASVALVSLGALALCTPVRAQPGPGFGPGFGGPGPGFAMFGGGPGASLSSQYGRLLNAPTVQKELNLTEDQQAKIKEIRDKGRAAGRELFSGMRDWSEEERRTKMEEIGKKSQAQAEENALLPKQLERLKGIALQAAGVQALNDKQVQQDLKLEDYQTAAIRVIGARSGKKIRELFTGGGDPQTAGSKIEEIRKESEKQTVDLLTDDQKASLERMKGDKLEVPAAPAAVVRVAMARADATSEERLENGNHFRPSAILPASSAATAIPR
jgi:Spy/CpxP family protein refolding chaperone